ncbi:hypothetical protein MAR_015591, partial [Mya arenaria]
QCPTLAEPCENECFIGGGLDQSRCDAGKLCCSVTSTCALCTLPEGPPPQVTCEHNGVTYNVNDTFSKGDECNNTCRCDADGLVQCGNDTCQQTCEHGGQVYDDGANIPAGDDCNTCSCSDGQVSCTEKACMEEQCDMQSLRDCFVKMAESRESVHNCVEKQLRLCPAQFGALMTKFVGHHVQMFASDNRQAKITIQCLEESINTCSQCESSALSSISTMIETTMKMVCHPDTCNLGVAEQCVGEAFYHLHAPMYREGGSMMVCRKPVMEDNLSTDSGKHLLVKQYLTFVKDMKMQWEEKDPE